MDLGLPLAEEFQNHLILLAYYYLPDNTSGVQRAVRLAKYLPRNGFRCHVISSSHPAELTCIAGVAHVPNEQIGRSSAVWLGRVATFVQRFLPYNEQLPWVPHASSPLLPVQYREYRYNDPPSPAFPPAAILSPAPTFPETKTSPLPNKGAASFPEAPPTKLPRAPQPPRPPAASESNRGKDSTQPGERARTASPDRSRSKPQHSPGAKRAAGSPGLARSVAPKPPARLLSGSRPQRGLSPATTAPSGLIAVSLTPRSALHAPHFS